MTLLNAKGLNTPEKRRMLLHDLQRLKSDIAFIWETHFRDNKMPMLRSGLFPTVYHSTNQSAKSRGVSIVISSRVPWFYIDSIKDPGGRFLFLKGRIGEVEVTVVTIYAPNGNQETFISKTLGRLSEFTTGHLIVGGDLNIPFVPIEDTSSGRSCISFRVHRRIFQSLHRTQLIDVWRLFHPKEKDYTFYSTPHKSYSCIDIFFVPHAQLHAVRTVNIGPITWSDHAPISLTYALQDSLSIRSTQWRLNESLLQDTDVPEDVIKELGFYFKINDTPECDPGIVWEAHKTVIRGVLIKHRARIKHKCSEQLKLLHEELATLELRHKRVQTLSLERDLLAKRTQIVDLLQYKAKAALQICRKVSNESGGKCWKVLARTLREQKLKTYIPQVAAPNRPKVM